MWDTSQSANNFDITQAKLFTSRAGTCHPSESQTIGREIAMADRILPQDALAALAKALGTLSVFAARREGLSVKEVFSAS